MQMYYTFLTQLSIIMSAAGVATCFICLSHIGFSHFSKHQKHQFRLFFASTLVYLFSTLLWDILHYIDYSESEIVLFKTLTLFQYLSPGFMSFMMCRTIISVIDVHRHIRLISVLLRVLLAAQIVLVTVSQFTDLLYYYEIETSTYEFEGELMNYVVISYSRSRLFFLSYIAPLAMLSVSAFMLSVTRKQLGGKLKAALWLLILGSAAGAVLQLFIEGIYFIGITTAIVIAFLFNVLNSDLAEENLKRQIEASRLETELKTAAKIQTDMLPRSFPAFPDRKEFDIFASMKPAKEVGGDFYDYFLIDEDHLGLVIADVSDKGIPAALFMMTSMTAIRDNAKLWRSPARALEAANNEICRNGGDDMFVTVWLGILDIRSGVLTSANAGHEHPALKTADGSFELVKYDHDIYIGYMEQMKYTEREIKLEKGAKLFLYTDGVTEATDPNNELFGFDRLTETLCSSEKGSPQEILSDVNEAVKRFVGEAPQVDDLTMMCLCYYGSDRK